jgi:type IV pilus assembly protein PilW
LIAVLIAVISMLVIMETFITSEGRKRTIANGGDAQINGTFALASLRHEIQYSGYGVSPFSLLGCNLLLRTGVTLNNLAPTTINHPSIPAGDAHTDTLLVVYGNGNGSTEGDGVISKGSVSYTVQTPTSFSVGERIIAIPTLRPSPCNLVLETIAGINTNILTITTAPSMTKGTLYNSGPSPKVQVYAIRSGTLTVCDLTASNCTDTTKTNDPTVWIPLVRNIVSLRAQYARDTTTPAMDGIVDVYDQSTPSVPCGWARTTAVRLVVVARSPQPEREEVTAAAPTWAGSSTHAIDLSAGTDWNDFRYKTYETTIPLRNILLLGVQPGC